MHDPLDFPWDRVESAVFDAYIQRVVDYGGGPPTSLRFLQTLDRNLRSRKQENGRTRLAVYTFRRA